MAAAQETVYKRFAFIKPTKETKTDTRRKYETGLQDQYRTHIQTWN